MVNRSTDESDSPSETLTRLNLLHLISYPALDAPLVAGSWWLLFSKSFNDVVPWQVLVSLIPTVWTIYLFDRLYDSKNHVGGPPLRKQFAKQHPFLLKCLLVISSIGALGGALPLSKTIWIQASFVAIFTVAYFLICRWKASSARFPVKESVIGLCFAAGIGIPFEMPINWLKICALLVFAVLCVMNCLMISRAEAEYDQVADPSAWFATADRSFPFRIVIGSTALATLVLTFSGLPFILTASLLLAHLMLFRAMSSKHGQLVQPISDAALWLPGIAGVVWLILES